MSNTTEIIEHCYNNRNEEVDCEMQRLIYILIGVGFFVLLCVLPAILCIHEHVTGKNETQRNVRIQPRIQLEGIQVQTNIK
jgi:hypothetical protein